MTRISSKYTHLQIILHWLIAILIVAQYVGAETIEHFMHDAGITASSSAEIPLMARAHVLGGIAIGVLMLIRIILRFTSGAPALPKEETPIMKMIAHATHVTLYAALILLPVSGMVGWFGQVENALAAHNVLKVVLLAFVALHIVGALYHQFVLKNNLIKRMTFRN